MRKSFDDGGDDNYQQRARSLSKHGRRGEEMFSAAEFKDVFKLFDRNNSGSVDAAELYEIFQNFNFSCTKKQIERLIASADANGDGCLDVEEFISLMKRRVDNKKLTRQSWDSDLKEAFDELDRD